MVKTNKKPIVNKALADIQFCNRCGCNDDDETYYELDFGASGVYVCQACMNKLIQEILRSNREIYTN
jgi:predicted SprT family Zn-dependent metalloprotease